MGHYIKFLGFIDNLYRCIHIYVSVKLKAFTEHMYVYIYKLFYNILARFTPNFYHEQKNEGSPKEARFLIELIY